MTSTPLPPVPGRQPLPALPTVARPVAPVRRPGPYTTAARAFWDGRRLPVPGGVVAAAVTVGAAGGWVLLGHHAGVGAALVLVGTWVPAAWYLRRRPVADLVSLALVLALVTVVAVRDAGWLLALCLVVAAVVTTTVLVPARLARHVLAAPLVWAAGTLRALAWAVQGTAGRAARGRAELVPLLRGAAVAGLLLTVFGALFASADRVFASYLDVDLGLLPGRLVVGALVAGAVLTAAHLALAPPALPELARTAPRPVRRSEWLVPVVSLDVLVLAFLTVQLAAAVGGHDYVERTAGLTYAEYARTGFGQLVAATALTLVVVAVAARRAPRETVRDRVVARVGLGVLGVATLGVVASALSRMALYVDAFGLTRLRLLATAGEVTLGLVVVLVLVAGVRWAGPWLPRAAVQAVAVGMLALAAVNPDALIARHNTDPAREFTPDVLYLRGLSADALPTLAALPDPLRSCVLPGEADLRTTGVEWNLGRARATAALEQVAPGTGDCTDVVEPGR